MGVGHPRERALGNQPDEFAVFIRDDQAKWAKLMAALGIKPE